MPQIEQLEMNAHRAQLTCDMTALVDECRAIFDWEVPEVDESAADRLILKALRQTRDNIESAPFSGGTG